MNSTYYNNSLKLINNYSLSSRCYFTQISQIEAELESKHNEKLKKAVSEVETRWKEKYDELLQERDSLLQKLSTTANKVNYFSLAAVNLSILYFEMLTGFIIAGLIVLSYLCGDD